MKYTLEGFIEFIDSLSDGDLDKVRTIVLDKTKKQEETIDERLRNQHDKFINNIEEDKPYYPFIKINKYGFPFILSLGDNRPRALMILFIMVFLSEWNTNECTVTHKEMAEYFGCGESTIKDNVNFLIENNFIKRGNKKSNYYVNSYLIQNGNKDFRNYPFLFEMKYSIVGGRYNVNYNVFKDKK